MGMQKIVSVLAVFAMMLAMSGLAFAAVPDKLLVSEQPETLDADGVSCTDITVQLVAEYADGHEEPVKMCGIEVQCESQNPNVLQASTGGAVAVQWTDEFGKAKMEFCSTGSEEYNIGSVQIICRSIQLEEDSSSVRVERLRGDLIEATMCPQSGFDDLSPATQQILMSGPEFVLADALADIIADGESHVYITGQVKDVDCYGDRVPVKKAGTMRFKSLNTAVVKTCEPAGTVYYNMQGQKMTVIDDGAILVETDNGVALAEFCSTGDGQENTGFSMIVIESVDYLNMQPDQIKVTATSQYGTTYKDGYLAMSAMPSQILADGESCLKACAQTRDQDYRIIKKANWLVSFESDDTNIVEALYPTSPTDAGLTTDDTDDEGIAIAKYCSAGTFDALNVGEAEIRGAMMYIAELGSVTVETKTSQIWPVAVEATATMDLVNCDGVSTVTVTAQLLDRCNLTVGLAGRLINFHSSDIGLLKNPDPQGQQAVITVATDEFGKAKATFITTDCKSVDAGDVTIDVSTMSPDTTSPAIVTVVKPKGFVPDGVNVYTDQNALVTSHAKPYVIAADGMSPIEMTAQVCEWEPERCVGTFGNVWHVDCSHANLIDDPQLRQEVCLVAGCTWDPQDDVCSGFSTLPCNAFDGNENCCTGLGCTYGFCNPVKRCGMEIQFEIEDTHVVENVHDNVYAIEGTHNGDAYPSYVKMLTDAEGKATIVLRSTGDAPVNKNICTLIKVTGKDGVIFDKKAFAEVCTKGYAGMHPNALWVWAEPAYITADGKSHTTVRTALYYCYNEEEMPTISKTLDQQNDYNYLFENCKPVKKSGVTVKFETLNTDALDDGMGGYKIYDITDAYGQAHATFQSKGFDKQHMGPAEIEAWTIGSGENVIQLNTLIVGLEEKTWPWCPPMGDWFDVGSPEAEADQDHDQYITDNELIEYIMNVWFPSGHSDDDDMALIRVIQAWETQL